MKLASVAGGDLAMTGPPRQSRRVAGEGPCCDFCYEEIYGEQISRNWLIIISSETFSHVAPQGQLITSNFGGFSFVSMVINDPFIGFSSCA